MKKVDLLLINPYYHKRTGSSTLFPLGLGYISRFVRDNGFTVKIIDCALYFDDITLINSFKDWFEKIVLKIDPLLIGIGPTTTPSIKSIIEINKICRNRLKKTPIIYGGPLASIESQKWLFSDVLEADAVISGAGEYIVVDILKYLKKNTESGEIKEIISNVITAHSNKELNLDECNYPDRSYNRQYKPSIRRDLFLYPVATVVGSRGCPRSCNFCVSGSFNNYRRRNFLSIVEEMKFLVKDKNIKSLIFFDDCFFPNRTTVNQEIESFTKQIVARKLDVSWQIEMPPDILSEIEIENFRNLIKAGCRQINIGFETNNNHDLKSFNKHYNLNKVKNKCDEIKSLKNLLKINGTFILTSTNSSINSIDDIIYYSKNLNLLFAHFNPLFLYPGTNLYDSVFPDQPKRWFEMILSKEDFYGEILYKNNNFNDNEIINQVSKAYKCFYDKDWESMAYKIFTNKFNTIKTKINQIKMNRFNQYDQI